MKSLTIALLLVLLSTVTLVAQNEAEKTELEIHGFVRLNATVDF